MSAISSEIERLRAENERSELGRHRLGEALKVAVARAASAEAERDDLKGKLAIRVDHLVSIATAVDAHAVAAITRERDALAAKLAVMDAALAKVQHWAESRCPCHNEQPNPCPLCGASVENFEACKSAENTLPRDVLDIIRRAREARPRAHGGKDG